MKSKKTRFNIGYSSAALLIICNTAYAQNQVKDFEDPSIVNGQVGYDDPDFPKDDLFDPNAKDSVDIGELGSEQPTDWDGMIGDSFGMPGDEVGKRRARTPEKQADVLPPVDIANRLINESSLPMLTMFGKDEGNVDAWPKGKTWLTGQLPVSRQYNLKGCKFNLKTGPISVAHYEKVGNEFDTLTDSMLPLVSVAPAPGKRALYLSANADLYPEVDQSTLQACNTSLKGKIIAIGKFDLGASAMTLSGTKIKYTVKIVDKTLVKPVQVYLYWPQGRTEPLLIDDSGIFPVMSTPIFQIASNDKGHGFLEVIPHLTYNKGGKALTKAQLREFWGE